MAPHYGGSGGAAGVAGAENHQRLQGMLPGRLVRGRDSTRPPLPGRQEKKADLGNSREIRHGAELDMSAPPSALLPFRMRWNFPRRYTGTDKCVGSVRWVRRRLNVHALPRRTHTPNAAPLGESEIGFCGTGQVSWPGARNASRAQCGQLDNARSWVPELPAARCGQPARRVRGRPREPGCTARSATGARRRGRSRPGQPAKSAIGVTATRAGLRTAART